MEEVTLELTKFLHHAIEVVRNSDASFLAGFIGAIKLLHATGNDETQSGLGEAPGDNILPNEILLSLSSRREA